MAGDWIGAAAAPAGTAEPADVVGGRADDELTARLTAAPAVAAWSGRRQPNPLRPLTPLGHPALASTLR
jgi:hypothetical protein